MALKMAEEGIVQVPREDINHYEIKKRWGERNEDGTWSGMLGMLQRGEKDLIVNYITLTSERAEDFDVSITYHSEGFGVMLKVPPPLPRWLSLIHPFTYQLWIATGGVIIVVGAVFHLLNRPAQNSFTRNFLTVSQCLISQAFIRFPDRWLVRCFLGFWVCNAWLLTMFYTSNLIAVLTVPVYPRKIETQQELAKSDLRMCMVDYGEFVPEALTDSSDATLSTLGAKMELVPIVESLPYMGEEACISSVLKGTHAHTETHAYMKIMYSNLGYGDQVYCLKNQLYEGYLAFLFKKGTPWKYKFDIGMQRLVEAGLVEKWYRDFISEVENGPQKKDLFGLQPLTVAHLQGAFLILATGIIISFAVMLGEHVHHRTNGRTVQATPFGSPTNAEHHLGLSSCFSESDSLNINSRRIISSCNRNSEA